MMLRLRCDGCGLVAQYDATFIISRGHESVPCDGCNASIPIAVETAYLEEKLKEPPPLHQQVFENGTLVVFNNDDHVWHGEIALICDWKPHFYRLEVRGKKIWVPMTWVNKL